MGFWKWLVILVIVAFFGAGAYKLLRENSALSNETAELSQELQKVDEENEFLAGQIEYLKNPENLLKEVKAQFNYRQAGEELIIIVPSATTSTRP